ncbi:MAG: ATP synthase subunit I [Pseudomonadota bacterium]
MRNADKRLVKKALAVQVVLSLVLAAALLYFSVGHAVSALIGGLIASIANGLAALWLFGPYRAQAPGELVSVFYVAELIKLGVIVLAFIGVFSWFQPLIPAALFGCFIVVYLAPVLVAARR